MSMNEGKRAREKAQGDNVGNARRWGQADPAVCGQMLEKNICKVRKIYKQAIDGSE